MRQIYDCESEEYIEVPKEIEEFLSEIEDVCKKYDLSISHEDREGGFLVQKYKESNINWLKSADKDY